MKLATLAAREGPGRDGRLVVVSDDLAWYTEAALEVPSLREAVEDWERHAEELEALGRALAQRGIPHERFHEREALAPLPRVFRWIAGGADGAGAALGPARATVAAGADFAIGLCLVVGDLPPGANGEAALATVRLIGLGVVCGGVLHLSPALAAPAALGEAWAGGRLEAALKAELGGALCAAPGLATIDCAALLTAAAADHGLAAATVIVSAPLISGTLVAGSALRVAAKDAAGHSLFGAIELTG